MILCKFHAHSESKGGTALSVQFITGPAGSGKSTYVMQTVAEQLKRILEKKSF